MIVRAAQEEDFAEMALRGRTFWEQTEFGEDVPYSEESIIRWLPLMADQGLLFLAEEGPDIVGFIGGLSAPIYANDSYKSGAELFWYLDPAHRNGGAAMELLEAIENAARASGCTYWTMIALESMQPERVGEIYEKAGYKSFERSFTKRL